MRFKIRPGFHLFRDQGDAWSYQASGQASGIVPLAGPGDEREFSREWLASIARTGSLGKLEPIDREAIAYFADTVPLVAKTITNPELYAPPAEPDVVPDFQYRMRA